MYKILKKNGNVDVLFISYYKGPWQDLLRWWNGQILGEQESWSWTLSAVQSFRLRFQNNLQCQQMSIHEHNTIICQIFYESTSSHTTPPPGRPISDRTPDNIAFVCEAVEHSPRRLTRKQSQTSDMKRTSLQTMLKDDLYRFP